MPSTLYVATREKWRAWLAKHHRSEAEVWLVYYKKESGKPRIPYDDAVEEAICFGWIDSIAKTVDDEQFIQKFTPRRPGSKWSELNRKRLRKVISEGRMTDAGLALAPRGKASKEDTGLPDELKQALKKHPKAWKAFQALSPSRRKAYTRLMTEAKTEATRARRVQQAIAQLEQNTGDPNDIPPFIRKAMVANKEAWKNFQALAPSHRRQYVGWIMHAKHNETRERRLRESLTLLVQGRKLGLK